MEKSEFIITSVLGFNLKADIRDINGNVISANIKSVYPPEISKKISCKLTNKKFFTTFNEELLNKIIDYKRLNE